MSSILTGSTILSRNSAGFQTKHFPIPHASTRERITKVLSQSGDYPGSLIAVRSRSITPAGVALALAYCAPPDPKKRNAAATGIANGASDGVLGRTSGNVDQPDLSDKGGIRLGTTRGRGGSPQVHARAGWVSMTALAPHARPKIARLVAMLATDHDGEASAAVRALGRTLDRVGADFNDLAAVIEAGAMNDFVPCETWSTAMTVDAVKAPLGCGRLSNWERPYVNDIARIMYAGRGLSTAQNAKLKQIYGQRAGGAS